MSINNRILQRTFRIRCGRMTGTCFTVDVARRRYLVTAKHIAGAVNHEAVVEIAHEGTWKHLQVGLVGHGDGEIDVSVLAPQQLFGGSAPLTIPGPMTLAEDVYFLGFPFDMSLDVGKLNADFPLPLVKKAVLSAFFTDKGLVLLDGHNNPGFSGGPVVGSGGDRLIGVVSGYRNQRQAVLDSDENEGPYTYDMNTGIIHVWDSHQVNQLILDNPTGIEAG